VDIALIGTYAHPLALGLRYVSASLKRDGHRVRMLFMTSKRETARADFSPRLLDALIDRVRGAELIGLSLMTNTFHRARVLTEALRKGGIRAPIIWGGIHPTLAPEESLETADIVCVGEGERPVCALASAMEAGRDPTRIDGLWFRRNGQIIRNPVAELRNDLDSNPFPDYDYTDEHYVVSGDEFVPARPELLRGVLDRYRMQSARGCPYSCGFCNNAAQRLLHKGRGPWVRLRSVANVMAELEERVARYPSIEAVNIVDDLFLVRSEADLAEFTRLYTERINLPIEFDVHPMVVTPGKIAALRGLPIALASMGIQSGSQDTLYNIFNRRTPPARIAQAIELLSRNRIPAEYHYIIINPFEPDRNVIETIRFAARHHRGPAVVRLFPLALYPATPLYERAVAEGIIEGRHEEAYEVTYGSNVHMLRASYLTTVLRVVLALKNAGIPAWFAEAFAAAATSRVARFCLDRRWFPYAAFGAYCVGHFVHRKIVHQLLVRPLALLTRPFRKRSRPRPRSRADRSRGTCPDPASETAA